MNDKVVRFTKVGKASRRLKTCNVESVSPKAFHIPRKARNAAIAEEYDASTELETCSSETEITISPRSTFVYPSPSGSLSISKKTIMELGGTLELAHDMIDDSSSDEYHGNSSAPRPTMAADMDGLLSYVIMQNRFSREENILHSMINSIIDEESAAADIFSEYSFGIVDNNECEELCAHVSEAVYTF